MRVTVLGASFKNLNLGVGALAIGTSTCIAEGIDDPEITLLDYAQEPDSYPFRWKGRVIPINTLHMRMKPGAPQNAMVALALACVTRLLPARMREWAVSKNAILQHLRNSDLVLSIAGGDSFSDIYGLRRMFDVSLPQILAILMDKKLVLLPQTLGPFKGRLTIAMAKFILKRATTVYSRDTEGLEEMKRLLGEDADPERMKFCHDVGFVVPQQEPARLELAGLTLDHDPSTPLVGLNVSGLLYMGGYKRDDAFGFRDRYVELTYSLIDLLIREKKVRLLLIPHTLGEGSESDSDVCEQLYAELKEKYAGRIGLLRGYYNTSELKYVIGRCDFFMGARMHACIGALSLGVPAVAIAYSRKFIGVLEALGVADLVVDPRVMENPEILRRIGEAFERRSQFRRFLAERMPKVKAGILGLIPAILAPGGTRLASVSAQRD